MDIIPLILENYQYIFIAYGYYTAITKGVDHYNTGRWVYDKSMYIYKWVKGTHNEWETIENMTVINPRGSNLIIIRDDYDGGFTLLDKDKFKKKNNYQPHIQQTHTSDHPPEKPSHMDSS